MSALPWLRGVSTNLRAMAAEQKPKRGQKDDQRRGVSSISRREGRQPGCHARAERYPVREIHEKERRLRQNVLEFDNLPSAVVQPRVKKKCRLLRSHAPDRYTLASCADGGTQGLFVRIGI
jgi:hypothetical protein